MMLADVFRNMAPQTAATPAGEVVQGPWRLSDADWRRYNTDRILKMIETGPASKQGAAWDAAGRFGYSPTPAPVVPIGPRE